ncbi:MAG TPA: NAD(+) synthase [Myxococcaceae bacterium]|nr:NAD(+) synthase [Myxococcaceae bacterium]
MRLVRIGLASVDPTVGAVDSNVDRALSLAEAMARDGVTVGVYPEQVIGGYPPEDLVQWQGFIDRQWEALQRFTRATSGQPLVHVLGVAVAHRGIRYNCAAVVAGGRVVGLIPKEKLPTYSVFYEGRTFDRGRPGLALEHRGVPLGDQIFTFDFGMLAAEVCEDVWSAEGPMRRRAYAGAELVANVSASPYRVGTQESRRELLATRAADHQCTLAYVNLLGADDGLIFDGGGFVFQNGRQMLDAPRFREGFAAVTVDLDRTTRLRGENTTWRQDRAAYLARHPAVPVRDGSAAGFATRRDALRYPVPPGRSFFLPADQAPPSPRARYCEEVLDALALGVGGYFEKNPGFRCLGVALSGGRDSLLTLLVAHRYARKVRPENPGSLLQAFYMGSRYSSPETERAARTVCEELGVPFRSVSIDEAFERERAAVAEMLGPERPLTPITEQNIQARLRGQRMWSWSNSAHALFLQTGNMSERAVGYTTVGGDLEGGLAVIANVPKTVVAVLLEHLQERLQLDGIRQVLARPAGPELAPDQVGEEELMPFPVLDACFHLFAEEKLAPGEVEAVLGEMFPEVPAATLAAQVDRFVRLFLGSIYKWVQAPLSLHLGNLDLDRERALQLPVVHRPEWARPPPSPARAGASRPAAAAPRPKRRRPAKKVKGPRSR